MSSPTSSVVMCTSPEATDDYFTPASDTAASQEMAEEPAASTDDVPSPAGRSSHEYEKRLFDKAEMGCLGAQKRRKVYVASLESYIEALHKTIEEHNLCPVDVDDADKYAGLNSRVTKAMVAGLQKDINTITQELNETEKKNLELGEKCISEHNGLEHSEP